MAFNKGKSAQDYPTALMGVIALICQAVSVARWYNDRVTKAKDYPEDIPAAAVNIALKQLNNIRV